MITRLDKTMLSTPELKDGQIISLFAHLASFPGAPGVWGGRNRKG